jgi:acetoin utilization protein AcuB
MAPAARYTQEELMKRLKIPVDEYTTPSPLTVASSEPLERVAALMRENGFRHVPVVDGTEVSGIISERDVKLLAGIAGTEAVTAGDIMVVKPYCTESGTPLEQVVLEMSRRKIGSVIVVDGRQIVGIFTSTDALNALVEILRGELP